MYVKNLIFRNRGTKVGENACQISFQAKVGYGRQKTFHMKDTLPIHYHNATTANDNMSTYRHDLQRLNVLYPDIDMILNGKSHYAQLARRFLQMSSALCSNITFNMSKYFWF